jgi:hypothetical protein
MLDSIKTLHPTNNEKTVAHCLLGFNCKTGGTTDSKPKSIK